jgi:hypothetical protein
MDELNQHLAKHPPVTKQMVIDKLRESSEIVKAYLACNPSRQEALEFVENLVPRFVDPIYDLFYNHFISRAS